MRIYRPEPQQFIRLCIKQQGSDSAYITLVETTQEETKAYLIGLIEKQKLSIFATGKAINIQIREAEGSKNGKSISLTFKGLTPQQVKTLIETDLK